MKKLLTLVLALALTLSIAGCNNTTVDPVPSATPSAESTVSPSPTPTPEGFELTAENFPRLDGSTATIPLAEAVVATLLGIPRAEAAEFINFSTTTYAYQNLMREETDLLIVYEGLKETMDYVRDEFILAPIGRDALVFLVNAENPIDDITEEQLIAIYRGEITNWNQIGGSDGEIIPYQRDESSGSQSMFRKLVVGAAELVEAPAGLVISGMYGLVEAIANYDNGPRAIGYNVFYYVTQMKDDENVKMLSIGGVMPSSETIASGAYPYCNDFFAVIRKDTPLESSTYAVFNWLQGAQARDLMSHEHYVPLLP
ncbi:MAG: substrate-binding domain-containing protein [Oscillospiraceae bacterium]|jgi:phosphate transport system substrate-binding protein|nr:substrate-binding domain-containing protein [Oscillospiraceae bacterium]